MSAPISRNVYLRAYGLNSHLSLNFPGLWLTVHEPSAAIMIVVPNYSTYIGIVEIRQAFVYFYSSFVLMKSFRHLCVYENKALTHFLAFRDSKQFISWTR